MRRLVLGAAPALGWASRHATSSTRSSMIFWLSPRTGLRAHSETTTALAHGKEHLNPKKPYIPNWKAITYQPPNYNSPNARDEVAIIFLRPFLFCLCLAGIDAALGYGVSPEEHRGRKYFTMFRDWVEDINNESMNWLSNMTTEERADSTYLRWEQERSLFCKISKEKMKVMDWDNVGTQYYRYREPYPAVLHELQGRFHERWITESERLQGKTIPENPMFSIKVKDLTDRSAVEHILSLKEPYPVREDWKELYTWKKWTEPCP